MKDRPWTANIFYAGLQGFAQEEGSMRGVYLLLRTQPCVNTRTPPSSKMPGDGDVGQPSDFGPTTLNLMELQEAKTWILGGNLSNKLT